MGSVIISFKIFPSDADVDLKSLQSQIDNEMPTYASIHRFAEEPIAFGLNALVAHIVIPEDQPGGLDEVEKRLQKITGIGQIQTLMVRKATTL